MICYRGRFRVVNPGKLLALQKGWRAQVRKEI
jgi:hypothetical protein